MTRQDFEAMARALHRAKPQGQKEQELWARVCDEVKDACAGQCKSNFKHDLFSEVCVGDK
jgi:hypothetical protein